MQKLTRIGFVVMLFLGVESFTLAARGEVIKSFGFEANHFLQHPTKNQLFVTALDNTVKVIDIDSMSVIESIAVGSGPAGLAFSNSGDVLYVANSGSTFVVTVDTETFSVGESLPIGVAPYDIEVGGDGMLYITPKGERSEIIKYDPGNQVQVDEFGGHHIYRSNLLAMNREKTRLYSANRGLSPGTLLQFDVSGDEPVLLWGNGHGDLGSNGQDLELSDDGRFVTYCVGGGNAGYDIFMMRTTDFAVLGSFLVGAYPEEGEFSPDSTVYYAVHTGGHIDVWDTGDFTQLQEIDTYGEAYELCVDRSGQYLFGAFDSKVDVFDTGRSPDDRELVSLDLSGPAVINKLSDTFSAVANYDDGSTRYVTLVSDWSVEPAGMFTIDQGILRVGRVASVVETTVYASYTENGTTVEAEKPVQVRPYVAETGKIYWTYNSGDVIYKSNLDGTEKEQIINRGLRYPAGVDVDTADGRIYWASKWDRAIKRANVDGSGIEKIASTYGQPLNLALDTQAGKIYWTQDSPDAICRCDLDGSNVETIVNVGAPSKLDLDLVERKIYWTDISKVIRRADLDGDNLEDFITSEIYSPAGLAIDSRNRKIYWGDFNLDNIRRANLDGSGVEVFYSGIDYPVDIDVDAIGGRVYFADTYPGRILSSNLDGTELREFEASYRIWGISCASESDIPGDYETVEILGPDTVYEDGTAQYEAVLVYENGFRKYVTESGQWSMSSEEFGTVDSSGLLVSSSANYGGDFELYFSYSGNDLTVEGMKPVFFEPVMDTWHVDSVSGSDENDGLSHKSALSAIQTAIGRAEAGDRVLVWPGVYSENVEFGGKAISVSGAEGAAVIDGMDDFAVSFYNGEGEATVLSNFIIINSHIAVFCADSSPTLKNLTVVNNRYGLEAYAGAQPDVSSCIFWNNEYDDIFQCSARYSCIERGYEGKGNISADPLFVDFANGDYRLQSQMGRYWVDMDCWVLDDLSSPCINAGDPGSDIADEPSAHGGRVNMGAYGGTKQASKGPWVLRGDVNRDGIVNISDLALLSEQWLDSIEWMHKK